MSENNVSINESFIRYRDSLLREAEELLKDTKSLSIKRNGKEFKELLKDLIKAVREAQDFSSLVIYARDFKLLLDYFKVKEAEKPFARFMNFINEYVDFDVIKAAAENSKIASKVVSFVEGGVKTYVSHKKKVENRLDKSFQEVEKVQGNMFEYGKDKEKEGNNITVKNDISKHRKHKKKHTKTENPQVQIPVSGQESPLKEHENNQKENEQTQTRNVEIQTECESNIETVNEKQIVHEPTEPRNNVAPRRIHEPTETRENIAPHRINRLRNSKNEQEMTDKKNINEYKNQRTKPLSMKKDEEKMQQNKPFKRIYDNNKKQEINQNLKPEKLV